MTKTSANVGNRTNGYTAQWLSDAEIPLANKFYRTHKFRGKAKRHDPCLVIRHHSEIIACGCLRQLTDSQLLTGVAVAETHRGQGVSRLLVTQMREKFGDNTFTFPYRHLVAFYQSLGFVEEPPGAQPSAVLDRFQTYVKQGRDILIMRFVAE